MNKQLETAARDAGIGVTPLFDGARFELPPRPARRGLGLGMIVMGVFITGFMCLWMGGPLKGAMNTPPPMRWFLAGFGLLGLPGLGAGLAMLSGGMAVARGRSRVVIEIGGGRLRVTERFGPFRWSWKRPVTAIRRFMFKTPPSNMKEAAPHLAASGLIGPLLCADGAFKKPMWIAPLYPPDILRPLADALADAANIAAPTMEAPVIEVVDETEADGPEAEVPRPAGAASTVQDFEGGFAIHVPPAGLRKGSKGLFFFSLLWLAMCGLIFSAPLWAQDKGGSDPGPFLLFAVLFIGIGLAMLGGAIHMGRLRVMIAANAHTLGLRRISPFGTREVRMPRTEITAICVGPSGMTVNDRPVLELQFHLPAPKKKVGCLSQIDDGELRWLAFELRRRLHVPAHIQ